MSRPQNDRSQEPTPKSSTSYHSSPLLEFGERPGTHPPGTEQSSSSPQSPHQDSSVSEGYPSWLPKRPPPPAPRSTIHSSSAVGMFSESTTGGAGPSGDPWYGGRKPTPRSVRIVSLQNSNYGDKEQLHPRRESTDPSRAFSGAHTRVWSRATSAGMSPTLFSAGSVPRPRFRSSSLHLELLQSPSWKMRLWYYLFPIFVFMHIPLQTFFDFNAVFILLLVAKHPNPAAPGVAGSGSNWALGAAAYIASWVTQIFVVSIVYELVYSFIRRWRVKRPLVLPIYLSSPAFNLAAMTSYTNFCFLYHIRASAFLSEHGSLRDGLAETFYYYSQNLPTVALLLPRAGLSLALLLAFWNPQPEVLALADAGISPRDGTFFRRSDQTLTDYARGVLIANAAWSAWRILVLLVSWIGLWVLSGQGCAGLCGPRYRWEEEDGEKVTTVSTDTFNEGDALPWTWRESTLLRVIDAYEFCLTNKHPRTGSNRKDGTQSGRGGFDGIEKVLAAIGIGPSQPPARRGILSEDLFDSPAQEPDNLEEGTRKSPDIEVPAPAAQGREKHDSAPSGPLQDLPYPFTGRKAQVSSEDVVPFPPSPEPEEDSQSPPSGDTTGDDGAEEGFEEGLSGTVEDSELTSDDRRTSGSMSSLGHPLPSRYPWQFRVPPSRGTSFSSHQSPRQAVSTPRSRNTTSSNSRSTPSQSTGNRESSDSPMSYPSSGAPSPVGLTGGVIPMPPRHPQGRSRARTVPSPGSASSGSPVAFPGWARARGRAESGRTRTESDRSMMFGGTVPFVLDSDDEYEPNDDSLMEVPEAEGSVEEAEQHDVVGLLTTSSSPRASRTSLRQFASNLQQRSNRSRSRSGASRSASRSRTNSSNSREYARSRAQSLIQSIGAASRSSIELVRSRANSMARLSDSPYYSTSPDPMPSSPENNTFGHPIRQHPRIRTTVRAPPHDDSHAHSHDESHDEDDHDHDVSDTGELPSPISPPRSRTSSANDSFVGDATMTAVLPAALIERRRLTSDVSRFAPSEHYSVQTERPVAPGMPSPTYPTPITESATQAEPTRTLEPGSSPVARPGSPVVHPASPVVGPAQSPGSAPVPIPGRMQPEASMPDLSTANQSFVTAPATVQGTTESSGRTPSSWGTHFPPGQGRVWEP